MRMDAVRAAWNALPVAGISEILGGRRALILAPHADDESLGCGGLIALACMAGNPPVVAILTDGAASHPGSVAYPPARLREVREAEAMLATRLLGLPAENLFFPRFPDTSLAAHFKEATAWVLSLAMAQGCEVLFAPWIGDPHGDHEAAAIIAAATGYPVVCYPVWGWLREADFEDTVFNGWRLDISEMAEVKQGAILAHESQSGGLIQDSLDGFQLPADLLSVFARDFELFLQ